MPKGRARPGRARPSASRWWPTSRALPHETLLFSRGSFSFFFGSRIRWHFSKLPGRSSCRPSGHVCARRVFFAQIAARLRFFFFFLRPGRCGAERAERTVAPAVQRHGLVDAGMIDPCSVWITLGSMACPPPDPTGAGTHQFQRFRSWSRTSCIPDCSLPFVSPQEMPAALCPRARRGSLDGFEVAGGRCCEKGGERVGMGKSCSPHRAG